MTGMENVTSGFLLSLKGLVAALIFAVCLFSLLGYLGEFFWVFDLFAHFRVQYFLILALSAIICFFSTSVKSAIFVMVFALINFITIAPLFLSDVGKCSLYPERLRVLTLNVNSRAGDIEKVMKLIDESDVDLVALQEVSMRWLEQLAKQQVAYPFSVISPREDNFGIALLSRIPFTASRTVEIGGAGVPSIFATIDWKPVPVQVCVTHPLPPIGREYARYRDAQLDQLPESIEKNVPTILVGDLNTTPWGFTFKRLLNQTRLKNSAPPFGIQATWPAGNPLLRIPIDHILISPDLLVIERKVGENTGSDHLPVLAELALIQPSSS